MPASVCVCISEVFDVFNLGIYQQLHDVVDAIAAFCKIMKLFGRWREKKYDVFDGKMAMDDGAEDDAATPIIIVGLLAAIQCSFFLL